MTIERLEDRCRNVGIALLLLVLCALTPMRSVLAQCPDGSPPLCGRAAQRAGIPPTSLAVLYSRMFA